MIEDEVLFTPQLATIVVDLHRRVGRVIGEACSTTYLSFCLLASLRSHGGTMFLSDFPRSMIANENTVVVAAGELVSSGMAEKTRCSDDHRVVCLNEMPCGSRMLESGFSRIFEHLRLSVWRGHDDVDIDEIMHDFSGVAERLDIGTLEINHACHPVLTPAYLMILAALLRRWSQTVLQYAGLSFTEYRCLALLENRPGPLPCCSIAEMLMLERSSVSSVVARLQDRDFVEVGVGVDRRFKTISLTDKGEVSAALISAKLCKLTAELYAGTSPLLKTRTNELHMRMYSTYTC
ncbi:MarR family winged helix-turn-helix transcriptional regulator [Gordonibacter sp.]|uniref:MarR family winged helix-turn-helix transcriptional regulator n=1 Tax=Gordonibacter sp. TaxID=1968902 RepID=UPI002FC59D02